MTEFRHQGHFHRPHPHHHFGEQSQFGLGMGIGNGMGGEQGMGNPQLAAEQAHERMRQDVEMRVANRDVGGAFAELRMMRQREGELQFQRDLRRINADLHREGVLPSMHIVEAPNALGFHFQSDYINQMPRNPYAPRFPQRFGGMPNGGFNPNSFNPNYAPETQMGNTPYQSQLGVPNYYQNRQASPEQLWQQSPIRGQQNPNESGWGFEGHTYNGGRKGDPATAARSARIVAEVAEEMGVDPTVAVATMLVESGGNPYAVGDHGTSFGLFQLHKGGELGRMSPQQAFDPVTNARVALSEFRRHQGHYRDAGMEAAAAQRPRDRAAYAALIDQAMPEARRLVQQLMSQGG